LGKLNYSKPKFYHHVDDRAAVWFYSNKMWVKNFPCVMQKTISFCNVIKTEGIRRGSYICYQCIPVMQNTQIITQKLYIILNLICYILGQPVPVAVRSKA
jgi:hypothetical protein